MEAEEAVRRFEGFRGPIGGLAADAVLLRLVVLAAGARALKVDVEPDKLWCKYGEPPRVGVFSSGTLEREEIRGESITPGGGGILI